MDCRPPGFSVHGIWFSRQEHWSGLPCPPPGDRSNSGIKPRSPALQADSLPSEPPGKPKNTGVSSLSLPQGNFPTQESNWGLLHCRLSLYQLSYQESPRILEWVAYPFPRGTPNPGIKLESSALQADSWPAELPGEPSWKDTCLQIHQVVYISCIQLFCTSKIFSKMLKVIQRLIISPRNCTPRYIPRRNKIICPYKLIYKYSLKHFCNNQKWKQCKCLPANKWIKKMWYILTIEMIQQ